MKPLASSSHEPPGGKGKGKGVDDVLDDEAAIRLHEEAKEAEDDDEEEQDGEDPYADGDGFRRTKGRRPRDEQTDVIDIDEHDTEGKNAKMLSYFKKFMGFDGADVTLDFLLEDREARENREKMKTEEERDFVYSLQRLLDAWDLDADKQKEELKDCLRINSRGLPDKEWCYRLKHYLKDRHAKLMRERLMEEKKKNPDATSPSAVDPGPIIFTDEELKFIWSLHDRIKLETFRIRLFNEVYTTDTIQRFKSKAIGEEMSLDEPDPAHVWYRIFRKLRGEWSDADWHDDYRELEKQDPWFQTKYTLGLETFKEQNEYIAEQDDGNPWGSKEISNNKRG